MSFLPSVLFFLLLIATVYIWRVLSLHLRLVLRRPQIHTVSQEEIPSEVFEILKKDEAELKGLGFEFFGFMKSDSFFENIQFPTYELVFRHPGIETYASLSPILQPENGFTSRVVFINSFNRKYYFTCRMETGVVFSKQLPSFDIADSFRVSITESFQFHLRRVQSLLGMREPLDWIEGFQVYGKEYFAEGLQKKIFRQLPDSPTTNRFAPTNSEANSEPSPDIETSYRKEARYKYTILGALRVGLLTIENSAKRWKLLRKNPQDQIRPLADVWSYQHMSLIENAKDDSENNSLSKVIVFALLMTGAFFSFKGQDGWLSGLLIIAVIGIHEFGHFLAMKVFGYRDLKVYFIPFFGGVATGKKDDRHPRQEMLIYLAGPAFGLLVAFLSQFFATNSVVGETVNNFVFLSILINLLNLLPITPFDGGRIVELLIFSRWPKAKILFQGVSGVGLMMIGAWLHEGILRSLGIFLLVGIGHQLQHFKLTTKIQELKRKSQDISVILKEAFEILQEKKFAKMQFANRASTIRNILTTAVVAHPTKNDIAIVSSGIVFVLMTGLYLGPYSYIKRVESEYLVLKMSNDELTKLYTTEKDPDKRRKVAIHLASRYSIENDKKGLAILNSELKHCMSLGCSIEDEYSLLSSRSQFSSSLDSELATIDEAIKRNEKNKDWATNKDYFYALRLKCLERMAATEVLKKNYNGARSYLGQGIQYAQAKTVNPKYYLSLYVDLAWVEFDQKQLSKAGKILDSVRAYSEHPDYSYLKRQILLVDAWIEMEGGQALAAFQKLQKDREERKLLGERRYVYDVDLAVAAERAHQDNSKNISELRRFGDTDLRSPANDELTWNELRFDLNRRDVKIDFLNRQRLPKSFARQGPGEDI